MSDWLDLELSDHLAPVNAPEELWRRVNRATSLSRRHAPAFALPVAAVVTLILAGAIWFMARGQEQSPGFRQLPSSMRAESCLQCHL